MFPKNQTGKKRRPHRRLSSDKVIPAIERLYPHPPHQRFHMPAADLAPLGSQQASQHSRAGEGELQVQPIETPHDRGIGFRHQPWQVVDAATTDVQSLCLLIYRQIVCTVEHRLELSNPALLGAPSKYTFSCFSSPILIYTVFHSHA